MRFVLHVLWISALACGTHPAPTTIPITTRSPGARAAYEQGNQLRAEDKRNEAEAAFTRALELDPGFAHAYWMRALVRVPDGEVAHALDAKHPAQLDFRTARTLAATRPALERAWIEANVLAATRGPEDDDRERAAFDRLDALAGHLIVVQERRATIAQRRGDTVIALDADRKLAALEPTVAARWNVLANDYLALRRFAEATTAIDKALSLAPGDPAALDTQAEIALARGDLDAAERLFRRVAPASPQATAAVAAIQAARGDLDAARQTLETASAAATNDFEKYILGEALAWLHLAAGRTEQALALGEQAGRYGTALGGDPENGVLSRVSIAFAARDWRTALAESKRALALPAVWPIHRGAIIATAAIAASELGDDVAAAELEHALAEHSPQINHRVGPAQIRYRRALRSGDAAAAAGAFAILQRLDFAAAWARAEAARTYARAEDRTRLERTCAELRSPSRNMMVVATLRLSPCSS